MSGIGCGFILVDRREWGTADSVYVSLFMPYYSHGIVDAGTSRGFVYDPGLRSRRNNPYHRTWRPEQKSTAGHITTPRCTSPIKEDWYIKLDHSR
ncbi:DUF4948 family protein [Alistipes sp.]|uniref:DUF4948 family protein n=1 Tax=Alistipes sp. TaxID=1872444 RepID=UPI0039925FEB